MPAELDGVRAGDDAPEHNSPLSPRLSSGLHLNPESGEEFVQSPSTYFSGEEALRRESLPSTIRHGSTSYQGNLQTMDSHSSDPEMVEARPYVNLATRPIRHSTTSQRTIQSYAAPASGVGPPSHLRDPFFGRRDSIPPSNNLVTENAVSSVSQNRRPSAPLSTNREEIVQQVQRQDSNTHTLSGRSGSNAMEPVPELPTSVSSRDSLRPALAHPAQKRRRWMLGLIPLVAALLIAFITLLVLYIKARGNILEAIQPTPIILPQSSVMPITDSRIGAADAMIGTYFSTTASGALQTKLVYNDGHGRICVRTKSGTDWLTVQCLEGANPRADTPLTVLDWLGGPSIYFITADNFLSGIDHMPLNDTWKFSTLRDQKQPTHKQSQLSSVTWFNGTSAWLYYQDTDSQLREYGLDDYRGITWRDGAQGPLGLAVPGTGIGCSRWWLLSDGTEVLEVFVQVSGGAIKGHVYMETTWTPNVYAVDGTPNTVSEGAAITSTVIHENSSTLVLLVYFASNGYLTIQSRGTENQTNTVFDAFSAKRNIIQGDGSTTTGLVAYDSQSGPKIFFVKNDTILELSAPDIASNFTIFDVTSA